MLGALLRALGGRPRGERLARMQASPQWRKGKFHTGLPMRMHFGGMLHRYLTAKGTRTPLQPLPIVPTDPSLFIQAPASGLRVTWLGHASVLLELEGRRLLFDPMWGERASPSGGVGPKRFYGPPLALDQLPPLDAVVLSHDHFDHLDPGAVEGLAARGCRFIAPLGLGAHLEAWGVAPERITELDWWETLDLMGLSLACVPARHFSGRSLLDRDRTLWCGWAVLGAQRRFYYSGDSGYFDGFKAIGAKYGPFDAGCFDSGAYDPSWPDVHLGPEQAVQACLDVRAGLFIPMHWGTFNLALHGWTEPVERLLPAARAAGLAVAVPRPGESLEPASPPPLTRWWPDAAWEGADQAPVKSTGL